MNSLNGELVGETKRVKSRRQILFGSTAVLLLITIFLAGCTPQPTRVHPPLAQIFRPARDLTGKAPIIIIPGMLGSHLINSRTGEKVWPVARPDEDALKLPMSPDLKANRDDLVATDVVVTADLGFPAPEIKVYEDLIAALTNHAGYKRGNIDTPPPDGDRDTFYLFSYDWRRDNVETAHLLAEKISRLKEKLQRPDLQFNIAAHSMGGLIARYYLMYGGADVLDSAEAKVTWEGAAHVQKLVMIGSPNAGTMESLRTLVEGYSLVKNALGLFGKIPIDTVFSMPAAFQLLPNRASQHFYDSQLQPMTASLYEVDTWRRYQWSVFDPSHRRDVQKKMKMLYGADLQHAFNGYLADRETYLKAVLARARRFSEALDRKAEGTREAQISILAGDCEPTLRAVLILEDEGQFKTAFDPGKVKLQDTGLLRSQLDAVMFEAGDGRITRRSATAIGHDDFSARKAHLSVFGCEIHGDLPNNPTFQDNLLTILLN